LDLKFFTLGSAVFDGVLIGCGVMVVSTLGFRVFEIFLEFSARDSAVCNVLLGCGVMVLVCPWFPPLGVVGTFVPFVTSFFMGSAMSFCNWLAKKLGDIIWLHFFSGVQSGVHFDC
jgi:hypothetical protein